MDPHTHITVRDLTMAYGSFVLMRDLNFTVQRGDVFVIMGGSGCGKRSSDGHSPRDESRTSSEAMGFRVDRRCDRRERAWRAVRPRPRRQSAACSW